MKKVVLGIGLIAFVLFGVVNLQKASADNIKDHIKISIVDKDPSKDGKKDKEKDKKEASKDATGKKCADKKKECCDKKATAPCGEKKGTKTASGTGCCKPAGKSI